MQEEINLIQMTDLHISDWIYLQEEKAGVVGVAGVRPGGSDPSPIRSAVSTPAPPAASPAELSALVSSTEAQKQTLDAISDSQSNLLRELRSLQTVVSGLNRGVGMQAPPVGVAGAGSGALDGGMGDRVRMTAEGVQALSKKVEERIAEVKSELQRIQQSINGLGSLGGGGGGGGGGQGGLGWIPYLMISFTTFCVASLTWHTFTQHMKNQRYKMI